MTRRRKHSPNEPDWRSIVRQQLPELPVSAQRESEIVEELAQLLRDSSEGEGIDPSDSAAVRSWLERESSAWQELATAIARREQRALLKSTRTRAKPGFFAALTLTGLTNDVRYALRLFGRSPVLVVVVVLTLALGIGLNSAVFSVVNSIVFKPLPISKERELIRVFSRVPDGFASHEPSSYPDYLDLRAQANLLSDVAGYAMTFGAIEADGEAELAIGEMVTGSYFQTLGVTPQRGRLIGPEDDRREEPKLLAVLSHLAWQKRLGGASGVVGQELRINGQLVTVIGIAPRGFSGLFRGLEPEFWIPISAAEILGSFPTTNAGSFTPDTAMVDDRGRRWLWILARRNPGVSFDQALSQVETIAGRLMTEYKDTNEDRELVALPLGSVKVLPSIDGGIYTASYLLMGVVGLVLLIASFNLANVLLARALTRRREMATRLSIGASRQRIVRQLLIESLLLAFIGAGGGLLVAALFNAALSRFQIPLAVPISIESGLDLRVVVYTLAIAFLAALVFGLAPAAEALRTDLNSVLRADSKGGGSRRRRLQSALVVAQVTFSLLLLVFAGLSVRSLLNARNIDLGFDPHGAVGAVLSPDLQGYDESEVANFYSRLRDELEVIPGVSGVSQPSHLPLTLWINSTDALPTGKENLPLDEWFDVDTAVVDAQYFEVMRVPLLRGRGFLEEEGREERRVCVVNQTLAERFWPREEALGKTLRTSPEGEPYEVVGVAGDGKYRSLGESARAFMYTPIPPEWSTRSLVVRFDRPELAVTAEVGAAIRRVDDHLAISNLAPLAEIVSPSLLLPRASALVFGVLGLLGMSLAALGLYGVLAYMVGQRTHEIGIRVAVGAESRDIVRLVLRDGVVLVLTGALLGIAGSLVSSRALSSVLYGISPTDTTTLVGVVVFFLAVSMVAGFVPASRATRVDPIRALRHE